MALASTADVNLHLPADKSQAQDGDIKNLHIDAARLIRARLASTYDLSIIQTWVSPATTPEIIREVAGKLVAAKFYANLVAEDDASGSPFAQELYNEAIATLNDIRTGALTVIGVDGNELESSDFTELNFWPNNSTQAPSFAVADFFS